MEKENKDYRQALWLAEHMDDFEFRTVYACDFRSSLRQWYYGGRSESRARFLVSWFYTLFSCNFMVDHLVDPVWQMAEEYSEGKKLLKEIDEPGGTVRLHQVSSEKDKWIERVSLLSSVSRGAIRGKNLDCYLWNNSDTRDDRESYLRRVESRACRELKAASQNLSNLYSLKWARYRDAGVSRMNFVLSVLTMAALCFAVPALFYLVARLWQNGIRNLPLAVSFGQPFAWGTLAVWLISVGVALFRLPSYLMCVAGNLGWCLFMKKEFRREVDFLNLLDQAVPKGIEAYIRELQDRLRQAEADPDTMRACLQAPLHPALMDRLLPGAEKILRRMRRWDLDPFLRALEAHRFHSRFGTVCLFLLVFCLGQLLLMNGATVQSLYDLLY